MILSRRAPAGLGEAAAVPGAVAAGGAAAEAVLRHG